MTTYTLADVEAMNQHNPESTADLERRIQPGCTTKLMFVPGHGAPEAMWAKVTATHGGTYSGTLANQPTPGKGLPSFGDPVTFEGRHIITVTTG